MMVLLLLVVVVVGGGVGVGRFSDGGDCSCVLVVVVWGQGGTLMHV